MPTFMELQTRVKWQDRVTRRVGTEEVLVIDRRSKMRPGEFVDLKLREAQRILSPGPMGDEKPQSS